MWGAPGKITIRSDQDPIPVLANVYEAKTEWQTIAGAGTSTQLIGPIHFDITTMANIEKNTPTTSAGGNSPNNVLGGFTGSTLKRSLLRFPDLSAYAGLSTDSAILSLHNQDHSTSLDTSLGPVQAFRILAANSGWTEADISWNYRSVASTQQWAGGPNGLVAGTDYSNTQMGSEPFTAYDTASDPYWMHFTLDTDEFDALRAAQHGVILKLQNESAVSTTTVRFDTDDAVDTSVRPYLTVTFRPAILEDIEIDLVQEVILQATGGDAYFNNGSSASTSHAKLIENQLVRTKLHINGVANFSVYVPNGVTLRYQFVGPRDPNA